MEPKPHLDRVLRSFQYRLASLKVLAEETRLPVTSAIDRQASFVSIELLNTWVRFARAYYLSCACGCKTTGGSRVGVGHGRFRRYGDALAFAITHFRPKLVGKTAFSPLDEPTWYKQQTLEALANVLGLSVYSSVLTAFSYPTSAFTDLPVVRNFFAHRSAHTAEQVRVRVRRRALPARLRPSEFVCTVERGSASPIISVWISDLLQVSRLLCA